MSHSKAASNCEPDSVRAAASVQAHEHSRLSHNFAYKFATQSSADPLNQCVAATAVQVHVPGASKHALMTAEAATGLGATPGEGVCCIPRASGAPWSVPAASSGAAATSRLAAASSACHGVPHMSPCSYDMGGRGPHAEAPPLPSAAMVESHLAPRPAPAHSAPSVPRTHDYLTLGGRWA